MTRSLLLLLVLAPACKKGGPGGGDDTADGVCDVDADGFDAPSCGGEDCDDGAASVHPEAPDGGLEVELPGLKSGHLAFHVVDDDTLFLVKGGNDGLHLAERDADGWTVSDVGGGAFLYFVSVTLAADGAPHVAYGGAMEGAYHARRTGAEWTVEQLSADRIDGRTAVAVGPDGVAHVAYQEYFADLLVYQNDASGAWEQIPIPGAASYRGGIGLAMTVDDAGDVHLVHSESGGGLRYTARIDGSWVDERIDPSYSLDSDIEVDASGTVHLAYQGRDGLMLASGRAGSWSTQVLTPGTIKALDLRLRAAGPEVSFVTTEDGMATVGVVAADGEVVTGIASWIGSPSDAAVYTTSSDTTHLVHTGLEETIEYVRYGWADGVDQDCDGAADGRSGVDRDASPVDLGTSEADALCGWADALHDGAGSCPLEVDGDDCEARLAMCPTVAEFEDCQIGIAAGQCTDEVLPPACTTCRSGVDPEARLPALSGGDWEQVCAWSAAIQGGEGTVHTCDDGTVTVGTVEDCAADGEEFYATCDIPLGSLEDCMIAIARDPCEGMQDDACTPFMACFGM